MAWSVESDSFQVPRESLWVSYIASFVDLSKAGLLRGNVAPLLDDRLFDLPGVGPGPGADLPGLLGAPGDGGVLLHWLLGHGADLLGPLGALGVGGVAAGVVLALLLHLRLAPDHVVLHVVHLLFGPALGLVLSPADLRALHVTVLHQRSPANGGSLVEGNLLVLDEAALPEVLLAVLLLLRLVVGGVGGVAPPVIGVVALHHVVILRLLDHLHLVDASLSI